MSKKRKKKKENFLNKWRNKVSRILIKNWQIKDYQIFRKNI